MDVMLIYWRTSSLMTLIHYWIIRRSTVSIMSTGVYGIYHLVVHVLVRKRLYTNNDICWLWQLWFISNLYFSTLFLIGKLHWYFLYESLYIQDGFTKVRWPTTGSRILGSTHMVSCDFSHLHLCVCVCACTYTLEKMHLFAWKASTRLRCLCMYSCMCIDSVVKY